MDHVFVHGVEWVADIDADFTATVSHIFTAKRRAPKCSCDRKERVARLCSKCLLLNIPSLSSGLPGGFPVRYMAFESNPGRIRVRWVGLADDLAVPEKVFGHFDLPIAAPRLLGAKRAEVFIPVERSSSSEGWPWLPELRAALTGPHLVVDAEPETCEERDSDIKRFFWSGAFAHTTLPRKSGRTGLAAVPTYRLDLYQIDDHRGYPAKMEIKVTAGRRGEFFTVEDMRDRLLPEMAGLLCAIRYEFCFSSPPLGTLQVGMHYQPAGDGRGPGHGPLVELATTRALFLSGRGNETDGRLDRAVVNRLIRIGANRSMSAKATSKAIIAYGGLARCGNDELIAIDPVRVRVPVTKEILAKQGLGLPVGFVKAVADTPALGREALRQKVMEGLARTGDPRLSRLLLALDRDDVDIEAAQARLEALLAPAAGSMAVAV